MILDKTTSMLQSEYGWSCPQAVNGHCIPCRRPGTSGYDIFSRSCERGRQSRHSEFPHGNVIGLRNGLEHTVHCINRNRALASSCAPSSAVVLFSDIPSSWLIYAAVVLARLIGLFLSTYTEDCLAVGCTLIDNNCGVTSNAPSIPNE